MCKNVTSAQAFVTSASFADSQCMSAKAVKQNRQLGRVVAEFLETAAKEMSSDQADLLRRSAQLML